jgi:hypothetical protein
MEWTPDGGLASQARHQMVSQTGAVRSANRGLLREASDASGPAPLIASVRQLSTSRMKKGPVSDPDSYFAAIDPPKTHAVMEALRQHKIQFSVSVNPTPGEGEAECDVFWFWRTADIERIQKIICEAQSRPMA